MGEHFKGFILCTEKDNPEKKKKVIREEVTSSEQILKEEILFKR